jgi:hypothetical protein
MEKVRESNKKTSANAGWTSGLQYGGTGPLCVRACVA